MYHVASDLTRLRSKQNLFHLKFANRNLVADLVLEAARFRIIFSDPFLDRHAERSEFLGHLIAAEAETAGITRG